MQIEYHPAIEQELQDIIEYYNECSSGLGDKFLDEFEKQVLKIADMPKQWMVIKNDIRRSFIYGFPYVIYFRVVRTHLLRITVVKHQHRHPEVGLSRT